MEFILIAFAHFMALISPGPDFFLIMQTALRMPRIYAVTLCCGIAAANGFYIFFAVASLESLRNFHFLAVWLKYFGGAYLIFIGLSLLVSKKKNFEGSESFQYSNTLLIQFGVGFLSALLNPKNGIFYLSLFTVMVSETTPLHIRVIYGIWMCLVVLLWDIFIAACFGNKVLKEGFDGVIFGVEKVAGMVLIAFGVFLSVF